MYEPMKLHGRKKRGCQEEMLKIKKKSTIFSAIFDDWQVTSRLSLIVPYPMIN